MAIASEGKFVWFDYVAQDVAKAVEFYSALFDWNTHAIDLGDHTYTMLLVGEQGIGGIAKAPPAAPPIGHWLPYLSVDDIQAGCERVKALGGSVLAPPMKTGDFGTMAVVADSLGGTFALWRSARPDSTGDYTEKPGHWCWNELFTANTDASLAFYTPLGGYTVEKLEMKEGPYFVLHRDGKPRGGLSTPPTPGPQAWMPYVQVADTDATVERAKQLGANVHVAGEDVPGIGRIAIFSDPQGGMLGVLQPPA